MNPTIASAIQIGAGSSLSRSVKDIIDLARDLIAFSQLLSDYRQHPFLRPPIMSTQSAIMRKGKSQAYSMIDYLLVWSLRREGAGESYSGALAPVLELSGRCDGVQQSAAVGLQDSSFR